LQPDVLVGGGTAAAQALQQATGTIPIVVTGDPVGAGLAASLARPGGNVTGLSYFTVELSAKRLELLKQMGPDATRRAVLWNPTSPGSASSWSATQEAARALGVVALSVEVRGADDLAGAFETIARECADALNMLGDSILNVNSAPQLRDFIVRSRL